MFRLVAGFALLACWSPAARAALDPETGTPYHLQVVLHFAKHRLLAPVFFQDQVKRELQDSLQASLGYLAVVKVVDTHPLLKEVEARGLQRALDSWHWVSDVKLHFVLIDYANGAYEIQARQYDGLTGLPSPIVRQRETAERQLVAHEAARLVDEDFGLVGTVRNLNSDKTEITLKGSALPVPLEHWIKKEDVFAIARIVRPPRGTAEESSRLNWTLFQVEDGPQGGVCHGRVLHRYELPPPPVVGLEGYRCLKLGTGEDRLRVRVVTQGNLGTPIPGLQVKISDQPGPAGASEQKVTLADGRADSGRKYKNVALVEISYLKQPLTGQIPIEIVGDRTVIVPVEKKQGADRLGQLYFQRDRWLRHVYEGLDVAAVMVKELNAETSHESAQDKVEKDLTALASEIANLTEERENLVQQAQKDSPSKPLDLEEGDRQLKELKARREQLQSYRDKLVEIRRQENDPKHRKWLELAQKARLLEQDADFQQAIDLYQQIVNEAGNDPSIKGVPERLAALKRDWEPKGEKHKEARVFIYDTWPGLETAAQMKAKLPRAQAAFDTCKAVGDTLAPLKLLKVNLLHAAKLKKEVEELQHEESDDDRATAKTILDVTKGLQELNDAITDYEKAQAPRK